MARYIVRVELLVEGPDSADDFDYEGIHELLELARLNGANGEEPPIVDWAYPDNRIRPFEEADKVTYLDTYEEA